MQTKLIVSLCAVLALCGLVACVRGAKPVPKHESQPPEYWPVTEHGVPDTQPVIHVPDRARILELAAEMVKQRLLTKTACGDPFCDCGCADGGYCVCGKAAKWRPAQAAAAQATAQAMQMQCGPNGCSLVPVQGLSFQGGSCESGACGVGGGCSSGSCGASAGRGRIFGRRR